MSASPFARLALSPRPVDRAALAVGFFRGESFDARFDADNPKLHRTFQYPPGTRVDRPTKAADYTGLRVGRMVACHFITGIIRSGNHRRAIWVCRCDCGLYEYRAPAKWLKNSISEDSCEVCRRKIQMTKGVSVPKRTSKTTMPERLMRWVAEMRLLGLKDDEITLIRTIGIQTAGRSVDQIRSDITQGYQP